MPAPGLPSPRGPAALASGGFSLVRLGLTLPVFRSDAETPLAVARRAEALGLDGVFVFDHLWPLGRPGRPALHSLPLLGALAVETSRLVVGPLVARVSLLPDAVLVHALLTVRRLAGSRLVVGLGTGDGANQEENLAFGVPFPPVLERVASLVNCCRQLRAAGVPVWVGGLSRPLLRAASEADGWNGWGLSVERFRATAGEVRSLASLPGPGNPSLELTWGGQVLTGRTEEEAAAKLARHGDRPGLVHGTVDDLRAHLGRLAEAGATWAVCAPLDVGRDPDAVEMLAEARPTGR